MRPWGYAQLLVLVGCALLVALVINPLLVFVWKIRRNPYPLVLPACEKRRLRVFTRSSAANIPVNMALREAKVWIATPISVYPWATINMAGAAITITVLTRRRCITLKYSGGSADGCCWLSISAPAAPGARAGGSQIN